VSSSRLTRRFHLPSALRPASLRIEAEEARALVEARRALLIDVRRQDDPSSAIDGAVRIAPDEIPGRVVGFPRDVPIVLACT
jgi:rhodanese-related sulfurtransferase